MRGKSSDCNCIQKNLKNKLNASILHLHANLHVHAFEEKKNCNSRIRIFEVLYREKERQ